MNAFRHDRARVSETREQQTTDTVFMVRPCRFQSNPLTAASNAFQAQAPADDLELSNAIARSQFDRLVVTLRDVGVNCLVFEDTPEPHTPDAIFPNNWVSTHADGRVALYPMEAVNRRPERRAEVIKALRRFGIQVSEAHDFSAAETASRYLEGTGSLVFDRAQGIAFACESSRTHAELAAEVCEALGYRLVLFRASDRAGRAVYHTNVMMFVGISVALVCTESIHPEYRSEVLREIEFGGREIVEIGFDELDGFAGNMLELEGNDGAVIAMSQNAFDSLDVTARATLARHARLVASDISHIEAQSGGSVRCMLAEVHLPRAP